MAIFIYIIQTIGILIPLVGIIALLRRSHQSNNSMYLMATNIACLFMNAAYLLMMSANTVPEAMIVSKLEYMGGALFYYFFVCFLVSYFWKKFPKGPFYIWAGLESLITYLDLSDALTHLRFKEPPLNVFQIPTTEIFTPHMGENMIYVVRYCWIGFLLLCLLIYSHVRLIRAKDQMNRNNLARLIGAQFVVILSLMLYVYLDPFFDFVPILASFSILFIVLGVIKDEFFGITEMGHEWVFEQMEDAFVIVDNHYGYQDANAYALLIFEELRKTRKHRHIPETVHQLFVSTEEIHHIGNKYYEKKIVDIVDKGSVVGYSMLLVDVTRQYELMEKVQEEKERADAANRAKSAFVANVSHEIRTPMNAIVGMSQILLRRNLPKQEQGYVLNIRNSGNALLTIVNDILDMSKIESGKMELVEEDYAFTSMLDELGMIILNRIGDKPVELIYDIDPELPAKLHGDSLRIRQIILNLMNNATKFTEQGQVCLKISVEKIAERDVELLISVKDSGQGIREQDLSKLFDTFQQVDTRKNHHKEGTGLGLYISRQLVELMNGTISVRSEYGKGSEFYFNIHQKLVDERKAAQITDAFRAQVYVAGAMKNDIAMDVLRGLCDSYGLPFVSDILSGVSEGGRLYYFTDCYQQLSEEEKFFLFDNKAVIYNLSNPMIEEELAEGTQMLNKPLYSYNFCQAIVGGDETQAEEEKEEVEVTTFTAPEARILVVDDNEINRLIAGELLATLLIKVDTAEDGAQAVKKVQETEYDLILMDHIMPVMDGIEATQAIRKLEGDHYQNVPIVALTGNVGKEHQEEYLRIGMNDVTAKPIMLEEICEKLRKWMPGKIVDSQ